MPQGGIDLSAAAKAVVVCIISLCLLAQQCALLRICDTASVDLNKCTVPSGYVGLTYDDDGSTWSLAFAIVYTTICGLSFLGCAVIMCKADGCAKLYAAGLVVCVGLLTLFDYWVLIAIYTTGKDNDRDDDVINYETFQVAIIWFMQFYIYLNAAADAWFTDDEEQIDKDVLSR